MIIFLRKLIKFLPTLMLSIILAFAAWIAAVNSSDPSEQKAYSQQVAIQVLGQDPTMVLQGQVTQTITVVLNAPKSSWTILNAQPNRIRAYIDLSGLSSGTYQVPIQLQVDVKPMEVISISPQQITITLEEFTSQTKSVNLVMTGSPDIGYQAGEAELTSETAIISGPLSLVNQVNQVRAVISLLQAKEPIQADLHLQAVDQNGELLDGLTINPAIVGVSIPITQKGGYRNVVVKVTTQGSLADGYRLSNVSVNPPTVTVYSSDPKKVEELPGYIETQPISLESLRSDISIPVDLSLPDGISLVGQQQVTIQIGINAIESSISFTRLPIMIENLPETMVAVISPEVVDVILSGPLPVLDKIKAENIQVILDLKGKIAGTYQVVPIVISNSDEVKVESVLPGTVEVVVQSITPTPK